MGLFIKGYSYRTGSEKYFPRGYNGRKCCCRDHPFPEPEKFVSRPAGGEHPSIFTFRPATAPLCAIAAYMVKAEEDEDDEPVYEDEEEDDGEESEEGE